MDITWLGKRGFVIKGKNATILTDPNPELASHFSKGLSPQVVTISRAYSAVTFPTEREISPKLLQGPGEYEVSEVLIIGFATLYESRNDQGEITREKNTVYTLEMEDLVLCHLGDLQVPLTTEQIEEMSDVDILFAPVGNNKAFRASMETIALLEPRIVVPMDYPQGSPSPPSEILQVGEPTEAQSPSRLGLERFLKEMGVKDFQPQRRLHVTSSSLPQQTQIVVLDRVS